MFDWIYDHLINSLFFPVAVFVILIALMIMYLKKSK